MSDRLACQRRLNLAEMLEERANTRKANLPQTESRRTSALRSRAARYRSEAYAEAEADQREEIR